MLPSSLPQGSGKMEFTFVGWKFCSSDSKIYNYFVSFRHWTKNLISRFGLSVCVVFGQNSEVKSPLQNLTQREWKTVVTGMQVSDGRQLFVFLLLVPAIRSCEQSKLRCQSESTLHLTTSLFCSYTLKLIVQVCCKAKRTNHAWWSIRLILLPCVPLFNTTYNIYGKRASHSRGIFSQYLFPNLRWIVVIPQLFLLSFGVYM